MAGNCGTTTRPSSRAGGGVPGVQTLVLGREEHQGALEATTRGDGNAYHLSTPHERGAGAEAPEPTAATTTGAGTTTSEPWDGRTATTPEAAQASKQQDRRHQQHQWSQDRPRHDHQEPQREYQERGREWTEPAAHTKRALNIREGFLVWV